MKKTLAFTILFMTMIFNAAANITTSIDKTTIPLGEGFVLTLTADENLNDSPDLSVLQDNFKVYSTSVSRQNYIINGQSAASTTWQIGLIALKAGSQEIPAIAVGKSQTAPLKINVISAGSDAVSTGGEGSTNLIPQESVPAGDTTQTAAKYNIESFISEPQKTYYVQQQIIYNVILTDDGSLTGGEPVFNKKEAGNWIIRNLGRPQTDIKTIEGRRIRKTTFKYALFAQKSGELQIPEVWFNGYALGAKPPSTFGVFDQDIFNFSINMPTLFDMDTPVTLKVPAKEIKILPVPVDYPGSWWLPAEKVSLKANWLDNQPKFKVGEAVSREVVLQASGVTETQLPDIQFPQSPAFRQYPEKSTRQTGLINGLPVAEVKAVNVYVPERSGRQLLPEIAVDWYNTRTGSFAKAVIPAEEINVELNPQADGIKEHEETTENQDIQAYLLSSEEIRSPVSESSSVIKTASDKPIFLYFIIATVFAAGVLIGGLVFRRRPFGGKPQCEMHQYPEYLIKKAYQNDFRSLRDGLVSWATGFYPEYRIENLKDVAKATNNEQFAKQIDVILAKLYNPQDETLWNPKIFSDILKVLVKNKKQTAGKNTPLPPLYR